jgi:hypothetical protein
VADKQWDDVVPEEELRCIVGLPKREWTYRSLKEWWTERASEGRGHD